MSVARALTLKEAIDPVELAQQRFTHVVRTAAFSILTRLRKHGACTRQEIAEELATLESVKLLDLREYQLILILTLASKIGGFAGHGIAVQRGVGFVRGPVPERNLIPAYERNLYAKELASLRKKAGL